MPNAHETRRPGQPSSKPVIRERVADVVAYPPCHGDDDVLDWVCLKRKQVGPAREYPPGFLVALYYASRATGSLPELVTTLRHDDGLYQAVRHAYAAVTGRIVPHTPPSIDQIDYVIGRLTADDDALAEILHRMPRVEVAHARRHGNLLPGVAPNWAHPDPAHMIFGDGTIFRPYSDVHLVKDPRTGLLVAVGSRAKDAERARVQRVQREPGADGKDAMGINHLALYTWTEHGPIALCIDRALGGEAPVLVPMVDAVAEAAGDGVHTLVYDKAVVIGRITDHLMASHGIEVINKAVARAVPKGQLRAQRWLEEWAQADALQRLRRPLTKDELALEVTRLAGKLLDDGHLPPGLSIYRTTAGYDVIDSEFRRIVEPHPGAHRPHVDRLILDDQALFLDDGHGKKGDRCRVLRSSRERTDDGTWARRTQWLVPCPHGEWRLVKLWAPVDPGPRRRRWTEDRLTAQRVLAHMRPAPRGTDAFEIHNMRSIAESQNASAKATMTHRGRANHLALNRQVLDYRAWAVLINAATWQRHPDARPAWRPRRSPSARATDERRTS